MIQNTLLCLSFFAGTALALVIAGWISLREWRSARELHWTERARILWPARMAQRAVAGACMVTFITAWAFFRMGPPPWTPVLVGTMLGAAVGGYPFSRSIEPGLQFGSWMRQQAWRLFMLFLMLGIYFWLLITMPDHLHARDWVWAGLGLAVTLFLRSGRWIGWFFQKNDHDPLYQRLKRIVHQESEQVGRPVRRVLLADMGMANAFALPATGDLLFTRRLVQLLTDAELAAVCRHELAHLTEPRRVLIARLVGGVLWFPLVFINPVVHRWGILGLLVMYALVVAGIRALRTLSREMEVRADKVASAGDAASPDYARALEKLYEANQIPAVMRSKRGTHPSLYDRMLAAGVTPLYARPQVPQRMHWVGWLALSMPLVVIAGSFGWRAYGVLGRN